MSSHQGASGGRTSPRAYGAAVDPFVVGGVVPLGSDAYRSRAFEADCFAHLTSGQWVTLLGPRQHGKTSALVRLRARLQQEGLSAAIVDLQAYMRPKDPELRPFLEWLVREIRRGLDLPPAQNVNPGEDVTEALEQGCSGAGATVALLIDEATRMHPDVQHSFYSQLRAFHTANRGGFGAPIAERIALLFSGTFRPEAVIDDDNSPFNVSRIVVTGDLSKEDAEDLAAEVGDESLRPWGARAYDEVGGQPYLLQAILEPVFAEAEESREEALAAALQRIATGGDGHVPVLLRRVFLEAGADDLLIRMLQSPCGLAASGEGLFQFLDVVGLAKTEPASDGTLRLVPRNPLYTSAMLASPRLNADELLVNPETDAPSILTPLEEGALDWITDADLRRIVQDVHSGAVSAANGGYYRLALAGLGAAYEGMLLALLEQLDASVRQAAQLTVTLASGKKPSGPVGGWTFEALVGVAHAANALFHVPKSASEVMRDWRNLIHPELSRRRYQEQHLLRPEVIVMSAHIMKLLQATN